jgi:hypothetical protein
VHILSRIFLTSDIITLILTDFAGEVGIHTDTSSGVLGSSLILYDRDDKVKIEIGYFKEEEGGAPPGGVYGIRMMNPDGKIVTLRNFGGIFRLGGSGKGGNMLLTDKEDIGSVLALGSEAYVVIGQLRTDNNPGKPGKLDLRDARGKESIKLDGAKGDIVIHDEDHKHAFSLHTNVGGDHYAGIWLGANKSEDGNKPGKMWLRDARGEESIKLDGAKGDIVIHDEDHKHAFSLHSKFENYAGLWLGAKVSEGANKPGKMKLRDASGNDSIKLDGASGQIHLRDAGGKESIKLDGASGQIHLRDAGGRATIRLDGAIGDILLDNADCAEEFDIAESVEVEPGTVMVIDQEGKLRPSSKSYDKRVAGVISGAGDYKPGLVLDKKQSHNIRESLSLMGKVYCKVVAQSSQIQVGDLLTSSSTVGHAMKATAPRKAFGSVIGKALRPLKAGKGLIPILIALQ